MTQWDTDVRLMRADCYEQTGDLQSAILDIRSVLDIWSCEVLCLYVLVLTEHDGCWIRV